MRRLGMRHNSSVEKREVSLPHKVISGYRSNRIIILFELYTGSLTIIVLFSPSRVHVKVQERKARTARWDHSSRPHLPAFDRADEMAFALANAEKERESQNEAVLQEQSPASSIRHVRDEIDGGTKANDFLLETLDALEIRVEKMRETARSVEDEKTRLLDSLNTMMQSEAIDHLSEAEREELGLYIDRLITRCLTVDINIQTVRTPAQEESLEKVRGYMRDLIDTLLASLEQSTLRLKLYLNSCSGESGPIDEKFQGALLGCAAEDQKFIKKKLQEIKGSLNETNQFLAKLQALKLDL